MRWFNRYNFPYSNFHDLNLDWIISEMNRIREEWETVKTEWEQMKIDWAEFQERMEKLWADYQALMNRLWQEFKTQMETEWTDYQNQLDEAWQLYQEELNQAWNNYQTAMNNWKTQVDQDITNKFNEIDEKCRQCKAEVDQALANLTSQWTAFKTWVENYLANLDIASIIIPRVEQWLEDFDPSTLVLPVLTPEAFGAVGDGVTNDKEAFADLFAAATAQGKPIFLKPGATYRLNAGSPTLPTLTESLDGNGATIDLVGASQGIVVGEGVTIKDVNFGSQDTTNNSIIFIEGDHVLLDHVSGNDLQTRNLTAADGIILRDVTLFRGATLGSSSVPCTNLRIDNLKFGSTVSLNAATATIDGLIGGAGNPNFFIVASDEVVVGSSMDCQVMKDASTPGVVRVASYTNL